MKYSVLWDLVGILMKAFHRFFARKTFSLFDYVEGALYDFVSFGVDDPF